MGKEGKDEPSKKSPLRCTNETQFVFSTSNVGFTTVLNNIVEDDRISDKARGLYLRIVKWQNSPDHKIYLKGLYTAKDKETSVSSAIEELLLAGYLTRETLRSPKGTFAGYRYTVYTVPVEVDPSTIKLRKKKKATKKKPASAKKQVATIDEKVDATIDDNNPQNGSTSSIEPKLENPETEIPVTENPEMESPVLENPAHINKMCSNENVSNENMYNENLSNESNLSSSSIEYLSEEEERLHNYNRNADRELDIIMKFCQKENYKLRKCDARTLLESYDCIRIIRAITTATSTSTFLEGKVRSYKAYLISTLNDMFRSKTTNVTVNKHGRPGFNNFTPREYDYDALERKLLGWDED